MRFKQNELDLVYIQYPVPNLIQGTNKKPEPAARVFAFKHLNTKVLRESGQKMSFQANFNSIVSLILEKR